MTSEQQRKKHPRYLGDIVSDGESVIRKVYDISFDVFAHDADRRDFMTYRLLCVSEPTKNILAFDPTIADRYPEIPWRDVRDIGNLLRREYGNVDAEVVWKTVTCGNCTLVTVAQTELAKLDD